MKSGGVRGALAGWMVFLALAILASLTPLRVPALQFAGRDAAVLRQDARAAVTAEQRADVAQRRAEWQRLHGHLSPFGLLAWAQDLWPWLLGLGLALPLLGGLVGAQTTTASRPRPDASKENAGAGPAPAAVPIAGVPPVPPREAELAAPVSPRPGPEPEPARAHAPAKPPPEERPGEPPPWSPPPPPPPVRPPDPAAWDWRVRPALRPSARPKPPAVESPNRKRGEGGEK